VRTNPATVCWANAWVSVHGGVNVTVPVSVPPFSVPENEIEPMQRLQLPLFPSEPENVTVEPLMEPLVMIYASPVYFGLAGPLMGVIGGTPSTPVPDAAFSEVNTI